MARSTPAIAAGRAAHLACRKLCSAACPWAGGDYAAGQETSAIISRTISRFRIRRGDRECGRKRIHGSARTSFRHFALRSSVRAPEIRSEIRAEERHGLGSTGRPGVSRPDRGPHRASDSPEVLQQVRRTASLRAALPGTESLRVTPSWAWLPEKEACAPAIGKTNAYYWALPTNVLRSIEHIGGPAAASDQHLTIIFLI